MDNVLFLVDFLIFIFLKNNYGFLVLALQEGAHATFQRPLRYVTFLVTYATKVQVLHDFESNRLLSGSGEGNNRPPLNAPPGALHPAVFLERFRLPLLLVECWPRLARSLPLLKSLRQLHGLALGRGWLGTN